MRSTILVGREDKEKKQVVVKNAGAELSFPGGFRLPADLPKDAKDWKAEVKPEPADETAGRRNDIGPRAE